MKRFIFILLAFLSVNSFSQLPSNLKAYFTFNGSLNDSTGISSPGVNNGAVPCADRTGLNNKAYELNGSGNNIDISPDLNFGTTTMAFWFKPNTLNPVEQLMLSNATNSGTITTTGIEIRIENTSKIMVWIGSSQWNKSFYSNANIDITKWNHISVVIDNNYTNILIYINGSLDQSSPIVGGTYSKCLTTMRLGTRSNPTNEGPYNGKIDEVMIFNKALTATEAKLIYSLTNGIQNDHTNLDFNIYPNPVCNKNELRLNFSETITNNQIKLYQVDGIELPYTIQSQDANSFNLKIDNLSAGVYFMHVENEGKIITKKVVVLN